MRRIPSNPLEPLFDAAASRRMEKTALASTPPMRLMHRAGESVARLARALAPHARTIWVACGPGNNGGDGLVAATCLQQAFRASGLAAHVAVTLCADPQHLPPDADRALKMAQATGIHLQPHPPELFDLAIDALLGLGPIRPPEGNLALHIARLQTSTAPVLCVDLPSGLDPDNGCYWSGPLRQRLPGARHTLALLSLKPGLFTADGRDQAGIVWFDDLGVVQADPAGKQPTAWLSGEPLATPGRPHASHKGSHGDVFVVGGQDMAVAGAGMSGAAILAARAALHAGAGRVYLSLLGRAEDTTGPGWDPVCPELMFRSESAGMSGPLLDNATVICGCGGGAAVSRVLHDVLERAPVLVLDADGLNAVASEPRLSQKLRARRSRKQLTVLTPHPLEAGRLLGVSTQDIMADRLGAAGQISQGFDAICVLKGSGTVICAPGQAPYINASGNAALGTAGTGDVLAGMVGAALASMRDRSNGLQTVAEAVYRHGWLADRWELVSRRSSNGGQITLTADALARPSIIDGISPGA